jgi:hypothetical protein
MKIRLCVMSAMLLLPLLSARGTPLQPDWSDKSALDAIQKMRKKDFDSTLRDQAYKRQQNARKEATEEATRERKLRTAEASRERADKLGTAQQAKKLDEAIKQNDAYFRRQARDSAKVSATTDYDVAAIEADRLVKAERLALEKRQRDAWLAEPCQIKPIMSDADIAKCR